MLHNLKGGGVGLGGMRRTYAAVEVPHEEHELPLSDNIVAFVQAPERATRAVGCEDGDACCLSERLFGWQFIADVQVASEARKPVFRVQCAGGVARRNRRYGFY